MASTKYDIKKNENPPRVDWVKLKKRGGRPVAELAKLVAAGKMSAEDMEREIVAAASGVPECSINADGTLGVKCGSGFGFWGPASKHQSYLSYAEEIASFIKDHAALLR